MGKVMPIRRKGTGGTPTAGAHIDSASYTLLVETLVAFWNCALPRVTQAVTVPSWSV